MEQTRALIPIDNVFPPQLRDVESIRRTYGLTFLQAYLLRVGIFAVLVITAGAIGVILIFAVVYLLSFLGVAVAQATGLFDADFPSRAYNGWDYFRYFLAIGSLIIAYCLYRAFKEIKKL